MATVAPNPDFHMYPLNLHTTDRKQVEAFYRSVFAAGFKNYDNHIRNRWAVDGETVIVEGSCDAWLKGEFLGLTIPERRKVTIEQVAIITIRDGLIQGERVYYDLLGLKNLLAT